MLSPCCPPPADVAQTITTPADKQRGVNRVFASLAVGAVTFLVVAVVVTALLEQVIWPSVFVGVPVGVLAGALAAVGTALLLED